MLTTSDMTINATMFKARCLELMDMLASHKINRITITKRGKAVSVMERAEPAPPKRSVIGCLKDEYPLAAAHDWIDADFAIDWSLHMPTPDAMDADLQEQLKDQL